MENYERLLRLPEVLHLVGIKKSTWWVWVSENYAPQPIRFGKRCTAWKLSEIQAFIAKVSAHAEVE